jgi:uncharacterized caspase-like protein
VALVIGNSAYQNVSRLANPSNDSAAMSETFKSAGFDVVDLKRDLKVVEMRRALRDFSDQASDADIAVVYYAGHGVEIDGANYLIPVDAVLQRDIDAFDEAIPLDRLLTVIEPAKRLRLIILDACRDNPFSKTMARTIGSRIVGRGLAKVDLTGPNTLIAYAAKAGSAASDGDENNSPFTAALVKYLPRPGLDLRKALGFTRDEVLKVTNNRQEPFVYGSLGGNDVSLVPEAKPVSSAAEPADPDVAIRRAYELALDVGTRDIWDSFVANYPNSFYTDLAKAQRRKLAAEEARLAATEKARAAVEDQNRLAIEGAKAVEQARAAEQAKAAEQLQLAAEKKKAIEDARVAEAERAKAAAQAKAAEEVRLAAEKAAAKAKALEEARAVQQARLAADQKSREDAKATEAERARAVAQARAEEEANKAKAQDDKAVGQLAGLTPPEQAGQPAPQENSAADLPRLLRTELRRVGCNTGAVDGNWDAAAQRSLALFNKNAGTTLDVKIASLDALDTVRSKPARICPLVCDHGFRADGNTCTKIICRAGYELGDDNSCERIKVDKPARREAPAIATRPPADRPAVEKPAARVTGTTPEARYAQCRVMASAKYARKRGLFNAMERCVLNGGRF